MAERTDEWTSERGRRGVGEGLVAPLPGDEAGLVEEAEAGWKLCSFFCRRRVLLCGDWRI